MPPIRVMIVDDSAVMRKVLSEVLNQHQGIEVIGSAMDPIFALDKMKRNWPDVIILDVEMPRMDGLSFLRQIMTTRPTPVIICSTLTQKGTETSIQALSAGAAAVIAKPTMGLNQFLQESAADLVSAVRAAAGVNVHRLVSKPAAPGLRSSASGIPGGTIKHHPTALTLTTDTVVAIGTSTGGTQALEAVLTALPKVSPGMVIVQHMPEKFTEAFARRLNSLSEVEVLEAHNGDRVLPGRALIAPGGQHMTLVRNGAQYHVEVVSGPPVNRHKPSVDVLFRSVAKYAGKNAVGVIMTGMGNDGAHGLKEMRDAGASTVAQDEASCVVFGMPKEAIALGAAQQITSLELIPDMILELARRAR